MKLFFMDIKTIKDNNINFSQIYSSRSRKIYRSFEKESTIICFFMDALLYSMSQVIMYLFSKLRFIPVIATSDFRKGAKLLLRGEPYIIVDFQHVKPGKGGAFIRTKMKNMITNLTKEETFRSGEKFEVPNLEYKNMQYLYEQDGLYHFMDQETYEQVSFDKKQIEEALHYLREQIVYSILYFDEKPISVQPPLFIELMVKSTPPGVKGDTAQGAGTKPATLETGLVVQVPLFVNEGDTIKVDTREAIYIERVKK